MEIHILYKVPLTILYLLALFFARVASDGSGGRLLCSMYSLIEVIQEGEVVMLMVIKDFFIGPIPSVFLVACTNELFILGLRVLANQDNTSAQVFSLHGTLAISYSLKFSSFFGS